MNNLQNKNESLNNDNIEEVKPFTMRKWFICMMIPTLVMLVLTLFVLKGSMYSEKESVVNYNETGDIDYKVYLKDNSFYSDKYLGKDMQYVASLIDKININYKFDMKSDAKLNYNYKYNIKADLLITDPNDNNKILYKKTNVLVDEKTNKATLNIYSKTLNDNVMNTMKDMNEKSYTHIPIYDETNKHLVGIFSENSLFQYILEDKIIEVDENTKFNDIKKCIDIKFSKEIVKFVAKDNLYDDVVNEFISEFKNKNKLSCVMITQNGKETEKVIGIITAWDIIGR